VNDPRRLRDEADGLNADELRLLRAGLRSNVPRGAKRAVWVALAAQLSAAVASATAASGAAFSVVSLAKTVGLGLLLGATSVGAIALLRDVAGPAPAPVTSRSSSPSPGAPPVVASSHARVPTLDARPESAPTPATAAALPPRRGPSMAPAIAARESAVSSAPAAGPSAAAFPAEHAVRDSESQRVAEARQLLRLGRAGEALSALDEVAREFPNGALAQEREALAVEALRVSGRSAEARARATAFLARYPASPHAASVRHALE
jgi:hypothetical protein